ncbi:major facilitator superfamily domain-containing protein [Boeremia exigua]|uniref:major facilitator superfamily domain-containing protein n=1 Tax=Boeremia exigua TaxID=749465 RepID=UPI001E8EE17B|nr:major facilitator superfamily domain-containing protein [Boeremia exigua]KAH6629615.1 major facilitator superfamily domain-containing protein [Boeremia exigua]
MPNDIKDTKAMETKVERYEVASDGETGIVKPIQESAAMGTVTITDLNEIFLIPAPNPLNLLGLALVSGFGGLLTWYIPIYAAAGATYADITALMTYPSMFMGVGNLICMPLALAIGRRPVYLLSLLILIGSAVWAAYARNYNEHLGARMLLGFAAGQSEALVPMMIQEIHFVHERSTFLMWQSATQTVLAAVYVICASPIAGAIGPANWYILGAGLCAATLVASIFWVPESRYDRSLTAYGQFSAEEGGELNESRATAPHPVKLSERPALDTTRFLPRTIWSDMRLFDGKADWMEGVYGFINTFQVMLFPNVLWAFCLNGLTIGVNIAIGTTYGNIVHAPPYNWSDSSISYVNAGQIVVAFVALPLLGNGSDAIIRWRARRNGGVHEPENRLLLLWIPLLCGCIAATLYGLAAQSPGKYHWFVFVFANAAYYFAFVGANIAAITYLLDSYPARAGPILVVITAFRGFVSFGTSYGVAKFIETDGFNGTFGTYAGLTALFGLMGIPIFLYGKKIRAFTGRWAMKKASGHPSMSH